MDAGQFLAEGGRKHTLPPSLLGLKLSSVEVGTLSWEGQALAGSHCYSRNVCTHTLTRMYRFGILRDKSLDKVFGSANLVCVALSVYVCVS